MITITADGNNPTIFNCRPVQRTKRTSTDLINRNKDIYLIYLRSDMSNRVVYAYSVDIKDWPQWRSTYQYSDIDVHQTPNVSDEDVYTGQVNFEPAGYWYYIIYEVHFKETLQVEHDGQMWSMLKPGYAPIDNIGTYEDWPGDGPDPLTCRGVLGIAVEEGKLFVKEDPAAITYTQHTQTNDNYIYEQ